MEVNADELRKAVESTHGGKARLLETTTVAESFQGRPVWQGIVHVFELIDHPKASKCYAWSAPVEGTSKRRFYAVLHAPPVSSPADAVRAAIVEEHRQKQKPS